MLFRIFLRDIESNYQYHAGYDQPIQQPIHGHYNVTPHNVKSPYHINPAYDPYFHQPTEYPPTNYISEPINTTSQYPAAEYPDVRNCKLFLYSQKEISMKYRKIESECNLIFDDKGHT